MAAPTEDPGLPTTWQLQLTEPGTPHAGWVLGTDVDGIGFVAEHGRPAAGLEPDAGVTEWVAECLTVTGVALVAAGEHAWSVYIQD